MTEQHHHERRANNGATAKSRQALHERLRNQIRAEEQATARAEVTEDMCRSLRAVLAMSDATSDQKLAMVAAIARGSTPDEKGNEALALFDVALEGLSRGSTGQRRLALWAKAGESLFLGEELPSRQRVRDRVAQILFFAVYPESDGTISGVAAQLGITRLTLRNMMRRTGMYEAWRAGEFRARAPHLMIPLVQPLDPPMVAPMLTEGDTPPVAGEVECID